VRKQQAELYRGYRTAGIRMMEEMAPSAQTHRTGRVAKTLYAIHRFDKAHLVMLIEEGLIPRADGVAMLRGLRDMEDIGVAKARTESGGGLHSGEYFLIRRLGEEIGGRLHLARSSGDLSKVGRRMYLRDQLLLLIEQINAFRAALLTTAERHLDTVMPGYTHGQSAQPTTYGHQLLAWALALGRDVARARSAFERVNLSPAGAVIMTGSNFPLNRHRTAELLGFDEPELNTFDAIQAHDDGLEVAAVLAIHGHTMARINEDLMLWSTNEFGMIDVPDRFCGTSSIMMQKKNPSATQEIKGAGADAVGALMTAFMVEKGPTGMAVIDRRYASDGTERAFDHALRDLGWMIEMVPELIVDTELMRRRSGMFWAQATDVAGALVRELGMNWRSAHQIVGILVRYTYERGLTPQQVTTALLDEAAMEYFGEPVGLSEDALLAALDPAHFVRTRTLFGGPAPDEVRRRLPDYHAGLDHDRQWLTERQEQQRHAEALLEAAVDGYVSDPA
jgi:argininosuccinate lyase